MYTFLTDGVSYIFGGSINSDNENEEDNEDDDEEELVNVELIFRVRLDQAPLPGDLSSRLLFFAYILTKLYLD